MKKLKKLFDLIGIFTLCAGMILTTINKTTVKAQAEISVTAYLPLQSGFYYYDYFNGRKLYYLYNTIDNGGFFYDVPYIFAGGVNPDENQITSSMKNLIESTPRIINEATSIKEAMLNAITPDTSVSITVKDFWVFDVSSWFSQYIEGGIYYIQPYDEYHYKFYTSHGFFPDLLDLTNIQLTQFGIDIRRAAIENPDLDEEFYINYGWNEGYRIGKQEGFDDGYDEGYDFGYEKGKDDGYDEGFEDGKMEVHSPTPTEYFLYEFDNWIIPAIAVAVFGGGIFMLFSKKREV